MSDDLSELLARLQSLTPEQRAHLLAVTAGDAVGGDKVGGDKVSGDKIIDPQGIVIVSDDARINGVAVGINLGTIIFGADMTGLQREQLTRYLRRLAAKLQRLPLHGLAAHLDEGQGISLAKIYVMLATTGRVVVARDTPERLTTFLKTVAPAALKPAHDPNYALPDQAIVESQVWAVGNALELARATLATECVYQHKCLVILGDPGGGKSTFLRHLAWALARRVLDEFSDDTALFGWEDTRQLLPVLLPLRTLAGRIAIAGAEPATVSAVLRDEMMREYDARQADDLLDRALDSGVALLLFDGLDEVPLEAIPDVSADRLTTLRAVRAFAELHKMARIVLTCRVRAFTGSLRTELGWFIETIAPFTLGQIRRFVADWYTTLIKRGSITRDVGESQQQVLISVIAGNDHLRTMAGTPLLLTMMALVLSERGELPHDRPLLYERILEQLLGQWDQHRGGQSLTDVLAAPNLSSDDLRPILDQLSYQAHEQAISQDGRGRLTAKDLRYALAEFLEKVRVDDAWEAAKRCLAYFNERSGLLLPEDDGQAYAFAHLTLQEHGAGRHMLLQPNAIDLVMQHRADDRWREPISLGLGVIQKLYPMLADRIDRVLTELIDPDEAGLSKSRNRWYRDLILAAELGAERDWNLLRALITVDRIQRDLRRGLVELLSDKSQPLPVAERVRAGFLLGNLGDPRVPVALEQWKATCVENDMSHVTRYSSLITPYWCSVQHGIYRIGGWVNGEKVADVELPAFWIARFPVTVAQYALFVTSGYSPDAEHSWTSNGWKWKAKRTQPWGWGESNYNGQNQPVIGVSWYEATAFCAWLTDQIRDMLPKNYAVRLPTEAEWEAAAAYNEAKQCRTYPWGEEELDPERAIYDASNLNRPAPVGCCPTGIAACGALDMVGNVWEMMASNYQGYPERSNEAIKDFPNKDEDVAWRGGSYYNNSSFARCNARDKNTSIIGFSSGGFRVIIAPQIVR